VCGAILLNPNLDKCLLVKSWQRNLWSFPGGKINKDESELECAKREVPPAPSEREQLVEEFAPSLR